MKMVKSLLLGSAAGLVAVVGAQAADLPVKAKPVEYVKVCSLYGAGFYYIPGTDICLKIGGYVRWQAYYGTGNNPTTGALIGANSFDTRLGQASNDFSQRVRGVMTMDTRAQTEYGTLRTYLLMGFQNDTTIGSYAVANAGASGGVGPAFANGNGLYVPRAFIQWAGFTFGKAQSFYDIFSGAAISYFSMIASDTGDTGNNLAGYTWRFGNGVSATVAIEEGRRTAAQIVPTTSAAGVPIPGQFPFTGAVVANGSPIAVRYPDLVANIRVDQAWGSWQVMGALHDASAAYYTNGTGVGVITNGSPNDKIGFAIGTGASINTSFISPGDRFQFQVDYTEGALRYLSSSAYGGVSGSLGFSGQNSIGYGLFNDGVYGGVGTQVDLTKGWRLNLSYDHLWTPNLKTSIYGTYMAIKYSGAANALICNSIGVGTATTVGFTTLASCNNDWNVFDVGSRTQWNIRPDFYLGVDVLYRKLETASSGAVLNPFGAPTTIVGSRPGGLYNVQNQEALSLTFRAHRDIVP